MVFDNLYRVGSNKNLDWLTSQGEFKFIYVDIRSREDIERAILEEKPNVVFHLEDK